MVLKIFLLAGLLLFMSCTNIERNNPYDPDGINYIGDEFSYGSFTYEGETYYTIAIGTQTWMAMNLNYNASGSECYNNSGSNCKIYGRLYNWATAMNLPPGCNSTSCASLISEKHRGICPSGWHIPSDDDWEQLIGAVGGSSTAGKYLKALTVWNSNGNGEDTYGFSALPGGNGYFGIFSNVGNYGYWWSATEYDEDRASYLVMDNSSDDVFSYYFNKYNYLFSVRCLQD